MLDTIVKTALSLIADTSTLEVVSKQIAPLAMECVFTFEPHEFWDMLAKASYDVVIAESRSLGVRVASFVARVKRLQPEAFLLLIGDAEKDDRVSCRRMSQLDLPIAEGAVARALSRCGATSHELEPSENDLIVGSSTVMKELKQRVQLFAGVDATVLIEGESGTGKELVAKALHRLSARRDGPFIAVNAGAIPGEIVESELFGHLKGSFTSAVCNRVGHFELASGGTLFLDEIGTMRLDHQVRLLRVLQDGCITPVGSTKSVNVDVRVVAATNADLAGLIEAGLFREDLYYRLTVLRLRMPPLRDRCDDIPELAGHFVRRIARRHGVREKELSPRALEHLVGRHWRGNVRELENAIEHAMIVSQSDAVIGPRALPGSLGEENCGSDRRSLRLPTEGLDLNEAVSRIERDMILQSLELAGGNKSKAADLLRLKRTTFVEKMKRLHLLDFGGSATVAS